VGDSRLYRLRNSNLEQITEDHTWVARAMKAGDITPEQARMHPWRHVLSQCLGRKDLQHVDVYPLDGCAAWGSLAAYVVMVSPKNSLMI
jgi:serine/threonine protein phosphatase PrpC